MLIHGMGDARTDYTAAIMAAKTRAELAAIPSWGTYLEEHAQNGAAAQIIAGAHPPAPAPEMLPVTPVLVGVGLLFGWAILANMHGGR